MPLTQVFLGLGSNMQRERHFRAGLQALQALFSNLRCSPVFESQAVGICSEPFFNMVVAAQTELSLAALDRQLKRIEAENGRYATNRSGLSLDIDILLYGSDVGLFDGLLLPREEILRNAFVLWPLALLQPEWIHPVAQRSFADLWASARIEQQLWPVAFSWQSSELTPESLRQAFPQPA